MGLDEGRLLLAVELGSQRQIEIHEVRRGGVVGPRPRAFVVGEEALVRRCWGWGCASSLIVAEHACPCLWAGVLVGCGRRVASGAAPSRERAGSWTSDATAQRALRPGPGRRASCASAAQAGKLAGSSARAGAAPALRRRLACVQRLVRAILTAGSWASYVRVPTSIGQRSSGSSN